MGGDWNDGGELLRRNFEWQRTLGSFILAEKVHLGSIIGTVIIIFGLYTVLWGKSKDQKNSTATENGKVQELPITDGSKSTKLEDSMELPATYKCTGPGASFAGRVSWSRELTDEEAKPFLSLKKDHP
ncbi:hypothetical protein GOBAR_DD35076 [Gossypium barbadense]|nr:hypothetical protein GOBAR_DD35076 [Gossypium barbadense]